jgi:hypothetical protein
MSFFFHHAQNCSCSKVVSCFMGTKICHQQMIWSIFTSDKRVSCFLEACFCSDRVPLPRVRIVSKTPYDIFTPCPISFSVPAESSPYSEILSSQLIKRRAAQQQAPDIVFLSSSLTDEFKLIQYTKYLNM